MSGGFTIRPVTTADAGAIATLLTRVLDRGAATALRRDETSTDAQRAFIESLPSGSIYLAAVDPRTDRIVGVQDVLPHSQVAELGDISSFVDPERVREGVGSCLMRAMLERLEGTEIGELHAVVLRRNRAALGFYAAHGFELVGHADSARVVGVRSLTNDRRAAANVRSRWPVDVPGRFASRSAVDEGSRGSSTGGAP